MKPILRPTGLRRYTRKHLVHDRDAARAEVLRLEGVIRGLDATVIEQGEHIVQLTADAVDVGVERRLREAAVQRAIEAETKVLAYKAASDNANAITLPPMHRDIDDDEQATDPVGINVRTLRDALNPALA